MHENVYLVEAADSAAAFAEAARIGRVEAAGSGEGLTMEDGRPVSQRFVGVRKVIAISNAEIGHEQSEDPSTRGIELTYSVYTLSDEAAFEAFAASVLRAT